VYDLQVYHRYKKGIQMTDLTTYWIVASVITKVFVSSDGLTTERVQQWRPYLGPNNEPGITLLETDSTGKWADTWFLAKDPTMGTIEYSDTLPNGTFPLAPGYYIRWGTANMNVGDTLSYQAHQLNGNWGWNIATFAALLQSYAVPAGTFVNVVKIDWSQSWCNNLPYCTSQTTVTGSYWLAPGVGMIAMSFNGALPIVLGAMTKTQQ
jgi:hypothetical protein